MALPAGSDFPQEAQLARFNKYGEPMREEGTALSAKLCQLPWLEKFGFNTFAALAKQGVRAW
jgi:hypothetical protein